MIAEWEEPTGTPVRMRHVLRNGRVITVEWRALATRDLRMTLARLLVRHARREGEQQPPGRAHPSPSEDRAALGITIGGSG